MTEKSWVHRLFFDPYFEDALMKFRAQTGLGSTYALLNLLNEKFYELGFMDQKGYEYHRQKYGVPLLDDFERQLELKDKTLRVEIQEKELEIKKLTVKLTNIFEDWDHAPERSRDYYLKIAQRHPELEISQKILQKANGEKGESDF